MPKIKDSTYISHAGEGTIEHLQQELRNMYNRMNEYDIESNELGKLHIAALALRKKLFELQKI